jgi:hypothetical protein
MSSLTNTTPKLTMDFTDAYGIRRQCIQHIHNETGKAVTFVDFENGKATRIGMHPNNDEQHVIKSATDYLNTFFQNICADN